MFTVQSSTDVATVTKDTDTTGYQTQRCILHTHTHKRTDTHSHTQVVVSLTTTCEYHCQRHASIKTPDNNNDTAVNSGAHTRNLSSLVCQHLTVFYNSLTSRHRGQLSEDEDNHNSLYTKQIFMQILLQTSYIKL